MEADVVQEDCVPNGVAACRRCGLVSGGNAIRECQVFNKFCLFLENVTICRYVLKDMRVYESAVEVDFRLIAATLPSVEGDVFRMHM